MGLIWLALALLAVWVLLIVAFEVAGFLVHLLVFAAGVAVVAWLVRQASHHRTETPDRA